MRKGGRADLALVGLIGPIGDKIDAELAFGRFNGGIDLAGRNAMALGIELEVFDESLPSNASFRRAAAERSCDPLSRPAPVLRAPKFFDALLHDRTDWRISSMRTR